jgi:hypothetical protein
MRLGALEEAAGAIWSSMLGITYTLQMVPQDYMS